MRTIWRLSRESDEDLLIMLVNWSERLNRPFIGIEGMNREQTEKYVKRIRKQILKRMKQK